MFVCFVSLLASMFAFAPFVGVLACCFSGLVVCLFVCLFGCLVCLFCVVRCSVVFVIVCLFSSIC